MKKDDKQTYNVSKQFSDEMLRNLYSKRISKEKAKQVIKDVMCGHKASWDLLKYPVTSWVSLN